MDGHEWLVERFEENRSQSGFRIHHRGGRIVDIGLFADPARLGRLDLTILDH